MGYKMKEDYKIDIRVAAQDELTSLFFSLRILSVSPN